jgi:hypothetical protein
LLDAPANATVAFENVAVRFVVVVTSKIVAELPVIVHVPLPMLMVRVPEPLKLTKLDTATLLEPKLIVPFAVPSAID